MIDVGRDPFFSARIIPLNRSSARLNLLATSARSLGYRSFIVPLSTVREMVSTTVWLGASSFCSVDNSIVPAYGQPSVDLTEEKGSR